jgi:hypothetical protein
MKLVCISDTHSLHLRIPDGDALINASTCTVRYAPNNPPIVFDL